MEQELPEIYHQPRGHVSDLEFLTRTFVIFDTDDIIAVADIDYVLCMIISL